MLCLEAVAVGPGVEHHALLRVELAKDGFQFVVEAALIAVAPEDDAGMVDIARHHLLHNLTSDDSVVCPVPARLFALHVETQRVAGIQELRVCRVVAQSHSIHVHALDQQHILDILLLRQGATRFRTERVAVGALHDDLLPINKQTILLAAVDVIACLLPAGC